MSLIYRTVKTNVSLEIWNSKPFWMENLLPFISFFQATNTTFSRKKIKKQTTNQTTNQTKTTISNGKKTKTKNKRTPQTNKQKTRKETNKDSKREKYNILCSDFSLKSSFHIFILGTWFKASVQYKRSLERRAFLRNAQNGLIIVQILMN